MYINIEKEELLQGPKLLWYFKVHNGAKITKTLYTWMRLIEWKSSLKT